MLKIVCGDWDGVGGGGYPMTDTIPSKGPEITSTFISYVVKEPVVKHRLPYSVKDGLFYCLILIIDCSLKSR